MLSSKLPLALAYLTCLAFQVSMSHPEPLYCVMPSFEGFDDSLVIDLAEWPRPGTKFAPGTKLGFYCDGDKVLVGAETLTCVGPHWDSQNLPMCERQPNAAYNIIVKSVGSECTLPFGSDLVQLDSKPLPRKMIYGQIVQFKCANGAELSGVRQVRCARQGQLSSALPTCSKCRCSSPCRVPPSSGMSQANGTNLPSTVGCGETLYLRCPTGQNRQGLSSVTCQATSTDASGQSTCSWSGNFPSCRTCRDCQIPGNIVGSSLRQMNNQRLPQTWPCSKQLLLTCDTNYLLLGNSVVKCLDTMSGGSWDTAFPSCCEPCKAPNLSPTVKIAGQAVGATRPPVYQCGEVLDFYCNADEKMQGNVASITCNGPDWSDTPPTCKQCKTCQIPWQNILAASPGMIITTSDGRTLSQSDSDVDCECQLNFECPCGSYVVPNNTCLSCINGAWDNAFPTCQAYQCKKPPPPRMDPALSFVPVKSMYNIGESVTFNCTDSKVDGPTTATCQVDPTCCQARWSEYPTCHQECTDCKCPPLVWPATTPNGEITPTVRSVDKIICTNPGNNHRCEGFMCQQPPNFECPDGYELCSNVQCVKDTELSGHWEGIPPVCRKCDDCSIDTNAADRQLRQQNGDPLPSKVAKGQTLFVACTGGFKLDGVGVQGNVASLTCKNDAAAICAQQCGFTLPKCVPGQVCNKTCTANECNCKINLEQNGVTVSSTDQRSHCQTTNGQTTCTFQCGESVDIRCPDDQCPTSMPLVCRSHGQWAGDLPHCSPRCNSCTVPTHDDQLRERVSSSLNDLQFQYTRGATIRFECADPAWTIVGARQVSCQAGRQACGCDDCSWSDFFPVCVPPKPPNETCTTACQCIVKPGYDTNLRLLHLRNRGDRYTDQALPAGGLYPGQIFDCGQSICLECPDGMMIREGDPSWLKCDNCELPAFPKCVPVPTCQPCAVPTVFQYQNLQVTPALNPWPPVSFPCGSYRFSCTGDRQLQGSSAVTCFEGSFTTGTLPTCVDCAPCQTPTNADKGLGALQTSYPCGAVVTFNCMNKDVKLMGKKQVFCNAGKWSDPFPECKAPPCASPPPDSLRLRGIEIDHDEEEGIISLTDGIVHAGARLKFRCINADATIIGSSTVRCLGPNWRHEFPTCA